jgi:hypothetical protein
VTKEARDASDAATIGSSRRHFATLTRFATGLDSTDVEIRDMREGHPGGEFLA